jgi:hypothetical protein
VMLENTQAWRTWFHEICADTLMIAGSGVAVPTGASDFKVIDVGKRP